MTTNLPFVLPLPFVSALLAAVIALRLASCALGSAASRACFASLFVLLACEAVLVGMRFGYGVETFVPLQRILPLAVGPLLWSGFRALEEAPKYGAAIAAHLAGALTSAVACLAIPRLALWTDVLIAASYAFYLVRLVQLWRRGPDDLAWVALCHVAPMRLWLLAAIALLGFLLLLDGVIAIDFAASGGQRATMLIGVGNLVLILATALVALGPSRAPRARAVRTAAPITSTPEAEALARRAAALLDTTGLHRDPTLTLARLARRLGVPARTLSDAINRVHGSNVSQFVNERRVRDAAKRLAGSDVSVAEAMEGAGFLSRSNFYREFRRVHGVTPAVFRRRAAGRRAAGHAAGWD